MAKQSTGNTASPLRLWLKRMVLLSLAVQVFFVIYFFFKVTAHMPDGNSTRIKLGIALLILILLIIIYFLRWKKIKLIRTIVATGLRFLLYAHAAMLLYIFLLKWVNPPITLTQLGSWIS